jgi:phosphate-selective porin OprO/OprP
MKKRSTKLKWIGLALASLGVTMSGGALAHMQVESDGGLKVYNPADSCYWFSLGGRIDFDETIFSGDWREKGPFFPSGGNIRRAYVKLMGGVGDYLTYNFTTSFSGALVDFEDAWLNYAGIYENTNIRFGQFTPLYTIDDAGNWGTINDTVFLESALATTAFSIPNKALGLWFDTAIVDMFTVAATVYHPRQNPSVIFNNVNSPNNYFDANRSDRLGGALRLTFSPIHSEDTVLHIGALGRFQSMNNVRSGVGITQVTQYYQNYPATGLFSTTPEALARNTFSLLNTGPIRARSYNVVTGEALGIWGPFMIEGEYTQANVQRVPFRTDTTRGNVRFHGWHVQAAYVLTGESRGYDFATGTMQNPSPASRCGAWEIAARYSYLDLNDKNVFGGTEHNTTIGLNWFINDNVSLKFNYIRANIRNNPVQVANLVAPDIILAPIRRKRQLDIFGMRLGVMF